MKNKERIKKSIIKIFWWVLAIGLIILGALGYLEVYFEFTRQSRVLLLILFLLFSIGEVILTVYKERREAEDFYSQEIIQVFPHEDSQKTVKFFTDEYGNKCVALTLKYEPIPKSIKLWEGGYNAPPITLAVSGKVVVFKKSAYSNYEKYSKEGPLYQVRYFPRK